MELNRSDDSWRTHVFGVKFCDAGGFACSEEHAVPVGQAVTRADIQCAIDDSFGWKLKREHVPICGEVGLNFMLGDLLPKPPPTQTLEELRKHLPQHSHRSVAGKAVQECLCLHLFHRFRSILSREGCLCQLR